jgi:hypothetical protein
MAPARELRYSPNAMQHAIWRQCLSCNRVDVRSRRCTDANPQQLSPVSRPDAADRGRNESASHMPARSCAHVRVPGDRYRPGAETERPEWSPGERLIIRNGFGERFTCLAVSATPRREIASRVGTLLAAQGHWSRSVTVQAFATRCMGRNSQH